MEVERHVEESVESVEREVRRSEVREARTIRRESSRWVKLVGGKRKKERGRRGGGGGRNETGNGDGSLRESKEQFAEKVEEAVPWSVK